MPDLSRLIRVAALFFWIILAVYVRMVIQRWCSPFFATN